MGSGDDFKSTVQKAAKLAAMRKVEEAKQRRANLPAHAFREEVENTWLNLRAAVVDAVAEWDERLEPHGYRVGSEDTAAQGSLLAGLKVWVSGPTGDAGYPLTLTPVLQQPGYINYSGPRGNTINGNQGQFDLFTVAAEALIEHVRAYVDQQVR